MARAIRHVSVIQATQASLNLGRPIPAVAGRLCVRFRPLTSLRFAWSSPLSGSRCRDGRHSSGRPARGAYCLCDGWRQRCLRPRSQQEVWASARGAEGQDGVVAAEAERIA